MQALELMLNAGLSVSIAKGVQNSIGMIVTDSQGKDLTTYFIDLDESLDLCEAIGDLAVSCLGDVRVRRLVKL